MEIELKVGATKAIISTKGGFVEALSSENKDILYQRRDVVTDSGERKSRGGCHVCLPNFGPGGRTGLPQHGYGRISEWSIVEQDNNSVELALHGTGDYSYLDASLRYELLDSVLEMTLSLHNFSNNGLHVAPGFHPYFSVDASKAFYVDGGKLSDKENVGNAKFIGGDSHKIVTGNTHITLHSAELNKWAVWSDGPKNYICVEPTQSGNSFEEGFKNSDAINAQGSKEYTFTISWK